MNNLPAGGPKLVIPRWIQLVGLPLLLLLAWAVAGAVRHAIFLFLVATLLALLLNPLVRALGRIRIRRGLAVAIVYLAFAAVLIVAIVAIGSVVTDQSRRAANRVDTYFTKVDRKTGQVAADQDAESLQRWLNTHHLSGIHVDKQLHKLVDQIRKKDVGKYTNRVVRFLEGAAISFGKTVFDAVLVLVASIYMLLDFQRLKRVVDRRFPPRGDTLPLMERIESAVVGYLKGQLLLSLIIGGSAGLALYLFGVTGVVHNADKWALLFGAWVAVTELIPYLGPWLGAIPPVIFALFTHPLAALWVALLFLVIHQVEGHIVVPNVMGNALRLHPLLVIFGLLAGAEIYGLPGILVALPLLAVMRAIWEFFSERVEMEPWTGSGPVPVEVELEGPAPPPDQPAADAASG